ncbi:MAG TPA: lysine--tRNA ligase, partial [Alphaproteobacteria bacterium]|nr:lysine--tRNA ligase [Alphaproteobacteria bacterium]
MSEELRGQRLAKRRELESLGISCYGGRFDATHTAAGAIAALASLSPEEEHATVRLAGRLKALRWHGKTIFADLVDSSGKIQLFINKEVLGQERFSMVKLFDIGDIVGVAGPVFTTRTGESSVRVEEVVLLAKSIRPLPEKWHGLR